MKTDQVLGSIFEFASKGDYNELDWRTVGSGRSLNMCFMVLTGEKELMIVLTKNAFREKTVDNDGWQQKEFKIELLVPFQIYYNWLQLIFNTLLPLSSLIGMNIQIYLTMKGRWGGSSLDQFNRCGH